jgi:hypothetical protein
MEIMQTRWRIWWNHDVDHWKMKMRWARLRTVENMRENWSDDERWIIERGWTRSCWRKEKKWLRWTEDVGDVERTLKIWKGSEDLPQTQGFACPHANCLRLSGSLLLEHVATRKQIVASFCWYHESI